MSDASFVPTVCYTLATCVLQDPTVMFSQGEAGTFANVTVAANIGSHASRGSEALVVTLTRREII